MFTPGEKHWTTAAPRFRRRPHGPDRPLLAVGLGLVGALAALARVAATLAGSGLPIGLAGVGGLLTATLLWSLLLGLLATTLLWSLLLRLLLTTLLWSLLRLLRSLLLAASEGAVGGLKEGIRLGQPGRTLSGVARGEIAVERAVDLPQVGEDGLSLLSLLRLLPETLELAAHGHPPQVGERCRLAGLEAQLLLGQLHDLRIGDGQAVGLADLSQDGLRDEGAGDLVPIRTQTLLTRLAGHGGHLLDHDVDVLLTHDDGVAGPVQAGECMSAT